MGLSLLCRPLSSDGQLALSGDTYCIPRPGALLSSFNQHRACAKLLNKMLTSSSAISWLWKGLNHLGKEMSTGLRVWDSGFKLWP